MQKTAARKTRSQSARVEMVFDKETVLKDFEVCCISREASILARKEVLTGKGKFGITGDGKEVPQVALAKVFRHGDFRSGYYRDQTWMFALGISSVEDFFAQLYADPHNDPFSGGRQMNNHFATPLIDPSTGAWTEHLAQYNVVSDVSNTGGQMARALGLALASKHYRENPALHAFDTFSHQGNEVCFCTIGDASTSEGVFWETVNAAGVMQVPLAIFVWDDGYGISVPVELQTTKGSISEALRGFQADEEREGIDIYTAKAWDYPAMVRMFTEAVDTMRQTHRPAVFHIQEVTQPQGHSTSGSHERYKSKERLAWEQENDCIVRMEQWILAEG
ncbi:MAG: thiamine pyrophosphate-dependent dehydrogenase E1 component subunit alpha, partial [Haliscomenobacter sp.]|nr:thiamine pyrophosphate-dependent dehydrogenase E1 component subunit alpha [Haliscomenobacter sp.]